jgi:hypothetical protein
MASVSAGEPEPRRLGLQEEADGMPDDVARLSEEVSRLRSEVAALSEMLSEVCDVLRVHIANVTLFNHEHLRGQTLDRLDRLLKSRGESS